MVGVLCTRMVCAMLLSHVGANLPFLPLALAFAFAQSFFSFMSGFSSIVWYWANQNYTKIQIVGWKLHSFLVTQ